MSQKELLESLKSGQIDVEDVIEAVMKVGSAEKRVLAAKILGVDPNRVIQEMFMGYKQRKQRKQLYGVDENIPNDLIGLYYELGDRMPFDSLKNAFVSRYITQESRLEEVHSPEEVEGLRAMYEYIHSDESDYMFNIYTLKELHQKLYSKAPYPEFGGTFRNDDVYLPGTGTEIAEWSMIRPMLNEIESSNNKLQNDIKVTKKTLDDYLMKKKKDNDNEKKGKRGKTILVDGVFLSSKGMLRSAQKGRNGQMNKRRKVNKSVDFKVNIINNNDNTNNVEGNKITELTKLYNKVNKSGYNEGFSSINKYISRYHKDKLKPIW